MPAEFALSEESLGEGRHVVAVRGEIDLFTAPELKKTLADAIENGAARVVVDLSETTFLDSTALGVLIGADCLLYTSPSPRDGIGSRVAACGG